MAEHLIEVFEVEFADGRKQGASKYGTIVPHAPNSGPRADLTGGWRFELDDGGILSPVGGDPDAFRVFETEELVRRVR